MAISSSSNRLTILIESTPDRLLREKSDLDLVLHLVRQLEDEQILDLQELAYIIDYFYSQIELIRDLSASRQERILFSC